MLEGLCAAHGLKESLVDLTFAEHRHNGKSKGMVYLGFKTARDAAKAKRLFEQTKRLSHTPLVTFVASHDIGHPFAADHTQQEMQNHPPQQHSYHNPHHHHHQHQQQQPYQPYQQQRQSYHPQHNSNHFGGAGGGGGGERGGGGAAAPYGGYAYRGPRPGGHPSSTARYNHHADHQGLFSIFGSQRSTFPEKLTIGWLQDNIRRMEEAAAAAEGDTDHDSVDDVVRTHLGYSRTHVYKLCRTLQDRHVSSSHEDPHSS